MSLTSSRRCGILYHPQRGWCRMNFSKMTVLELTEYVLDEKNPRANRSEALDELRDRSYNSGYQSGDEAGYHIGYANGQESER